MKHAREDYNRIQDPAGIIPEDEPVFLLRGQDKLAPMTLEYWAHLLEDQVLRTSDSDKIHNLLTMAGKANKQAQAMRDWQENNKAKLPDL